MNLHGIGTAANFKIGFADTRLRSQAGAVLMKDFLSRLSVAQTLDQEIDVHERERGSSLSESFLGWAFNLLLGVACLDDLDVLRGDPGTVALFGGEKLIAPRTAGDCLRRFQSGDRGDFPRALQTIAERVRPRQTREICALDLDASIFEQRSTRTEGSRMASHGQLGDHPRIAFWAEAGERLATQLMAGNRSPSRKARWLFKAVVRNAVPVGKKWQRRADSAF